MKLSKRIWDVVRANLASPRQVSGLGVAKSTARLERQMEQIRNSLAQAAAREQRLKDDLTEAEQEGRERDALRLQRERDDLARSTDELQAALELIEARIEIDRETRIEGKLPPAVKPGFAEEEVDSHQTSRGIQESETDLAARKTRLAAPDE